MDLLVFGDRVLLAVVYLLAAATKVAGRDAFEAFVVSVRAVPGVRLRAARPLAGVVVTVELAVAVLLAVPATARWGFALAAGLGAALTAVMAAQVAAGVRVACRCFGPSRIPPGRFHVVRNGALTLLAAGGWLAAPLVGADQPAAVLAFAGAVGLVAAIVVVALDEVLALFTDPAPTAAP
jgi:hypothetical protein